MSATSPETPRLAEALTLGSSPRSPLRGALAALLVAATVMAVFVGGAATADAAPTTSFKAVRVVDTPWGSHSRVTFQYPSSLRGKTVRVQGYKAYAANVQGFHYGTWKIRERMNMTTRLPHRGNRVTFTVPWDVADKPGRRTPADAVFKTDLYLSSVSTWRNSGVVIVSDKAKKGAVYGTGKAVIDRDPSKNVMYRRDYQAISDGMTPSQVNRLVGTRGEHVEQSQHRENGRRVTMSTYSWVTPTGSTATVTTKDGRVIGKHWQS